MSDVVDDTDFPPDLHIAPETVPGQLVTWSTFQGYGFQMSGLLAWIGKQRIGRIDNEAGGSATWYCSLPSETKPIDGTEDDEAAAIFALESFAQDWIDDAGLLTQFDANELTERQIWQEQEAEARLGGHGSDDSGY